MYKNCYISNMAVMNLHIFLRLIEYGWVSYYDYDISLQAFRRYIANIRFMLDEYHITYMSIVYDPLNKIYRLVKC